MTKPPRAIRTERPSAFLCNFKQSRILYSLLRFYEFLKSVLSHFESFYRAIQRFCAIFLLATCLNTHDVIRYDRGCHEHYVFDQPLEVYFIVNLTINTSTFVLFCQFLLLEALKLVESLNLLLRKGQKLESMAIHVHVFTLLQSTHFGCFQVKYADEPIFFTKHKREINEVETGKKLQIECSLTHSYAYNSLLACF